MNRQLLYINQLEKYKQKYQSDVIDSQGTIVDLQTELLASKNKLLDDLKSMVSVKQKFQQQILCWIWIETT